MFDTNTKSIVTDYANKHGFEPAELLAVCDVESAGVAFWNVDGKSLPPIRWEGHYFYARLNDSDRAAAVAAGLASPKAGAIPNPSSFSGRYALLAQAEAINKSAALESISIGLGQVMGANWQALGYASVDDLWSSAQTVEGQVDLMVRFIIKNNLKSYIDNEDWKAFAKAYNGPNYAKNGYDRKLSDAVARYRNGDTPTGLSLDEVSQLQKMLNTVGDYKLAVDGDFGVSTKTALRDFQLRHGLTVDGIYGPISRQTLSASYLAIVNKKNINIGISTSAAATAGAAVTETTKQIAAINSTSWVLQALCIGLILLGLFITLKATVFNRTS